MVVTITKAAEKTLREIEERFWESQGWEWRVQERRDCGLPYRERELMPSAMNQECFPIWSLAIHGDLPRVKISEWYGVARSLDAFVAHVVPVLVERGNWFGFNNRIGSVIQSRMGPEKQNPKWVEFCVTNASAKIRLACALDALAVPTPEPQPGEERATNWREWIGMMPGM